MASASPFHVECTVQTSVLPKLDGTAKLGVNGSCGWVMSTLAVWRTLLSLRLLAAASMKDLTMGVLGIFRKDTSRRGVTWTSWAWFAPVTT